MTWTLDSSGSQQATIGTEHILASPTTNATYVFSADMVGMINGTNVGDLVELRCYDMVDGLNLSQMWKGTYQNKQINNAKASPPLAVTTQARFTLKHVTLAVFAPNCTFTNGSPILGVTANVFAIGNTVTLSTTGTLPTNFATATTYFVIATGLSGTQLELSASYNGGAITAGSAGTGTHTITRTGNVFPWSVRRI